MWLLNWRLHSLSGAICHMVFKHCHCSCQFFFMTVQLAQLPRYRHEQHSSPIKIMWLPSISNKTGMNELLIVKSATHKQKHRRKNRRWCPSRSIRSTFTATVNRGRNAGWNQWKSPSFSEGVKQAPPMMIHILVTTLCTIWSAWKRHQKTTRKKNYLSRF